MIIDEILKKNRRYRIAHLHLKKTINNDKIFERLNVFLEEFCTYFKLSETEVINSYEAFSKVYLADLKNFEATAKYPVQLEEKSRDISRIDYDIALILSVYFEPVRYEIFDYVISSFDKISEEEKVLFIGIGPGIELEYLTKGSKNIDAYDLKISDFSKNRFNQMNLIEEIFIKKTDGYDKIYCVELLEHIDDPEGLMANVYESLKKGGEAYFTTASNMPQFDHLVNFYQRKFDEFLLATGFTINEKKNLYHNYNSLDIESFNSWYICKK